MYSVRRRLLLVLATGFAVLIAVSGLFVAGAVADRVTREFDATLLAKARALQALTEEESGTIQLDYTPEAMPEFERAERPEYFQFWLGDGTPLAAGRSRGLRPDRDLPRAGSAGPGPSIRDATLPDGRTGRLVELSYVPHPSAQQDEPAAAADPEEIGKTRGTPSLVLVVARDREGLDDTIAAVRVAVFGIGGLAVLLGALFVWRALAAGFRPIDAIASQVERLDADRMDGRVALPNAPRELTHVVERLNALLDRLAESLERQRRFAGNVAHELRTPIAELRSLAAVGARWPDDKEAIVKYFGDVDDVARRMEDVIADLLLLARCQAGVEGAASAPTGVKPLLESSWAKLEAAARARDLRWRLDVPEDLVVESDAGKLGIVFSNLLGNAVVYARPHGEVRCTGRRAGSRFRLEVTNPADPMRAGDLERLGEPFWRADESRSSAEHAGLGLALVTALASLLRLDVAFSQDPDGTFRVRLEGQALETGRAVDRSASLV
jgi:two-component system sensor histidine kinase QseC